MNVLILTGKFGMGHYSASHSLAAQIKKERKNTDVMIVDLFEYSMPACSCAIYDFFNVLVNHGSKLYNAFYKISEKNKIELKTPLMSYLTSKIDKLIQEYNPDLIISTLHICSQVVCLYKKHYRYQVPLITCITDLSCHPEWLATGTDLYLVASKRVKDDLLRQGIPDSIIHIIGIPVKPEFRQYMKHRHSPIRHILIMGGGLGLLPKTVSFYEAINSLENFKTTVITGSNRKLYKKLYGKYKNIEVIGYTDKVYKYMRNADLIISKPGGITLYETIYSCLPILSFKPFLQQEIDNSNFILDSNIGRVLSKNTKYCVEEIINLVNDEDTLEKIRHNMQRLKNEINSNGITDILFSVASKEVCA